MSLRLGHRRNPTRGGTARHGLAACLLTGALVLSACGGSEDVRASDPEVEDSATSTPEEPTPEAEETPEPTPEESAPPTPTSTEPQCDTVWLDGEPLPDPYDGCFEGETFVKAQSQRCAFGSRLFTYDDRFYAAQFNRINQTEGLGSDQAYRKALTQCGG